jgi:hypothetical protein
MRALGLLPVTDESLFHVATFVDDDAQYAAMRESFNRAGLDERVARFTRLDSGEPYGAVRELASSPEPYAILCHQDVRLDQGDGYAELIGLLAELTERDPHWAVAGNAGGTPNLELIRHIADPHGANWASNLPRPVVSLDENFVVLRLERRPRCSSELKGFHLYGTDVCLNAIADGSKAYVIGFRLTHLSPGSLQGYDEALSAFVTAWSRRSAFRYVRTTNSVVFLSGRRLLRRFFGDRRVIWRIEHRSWARAIAASATRLVAWLEPLANEPPTLPKSLVRRARPRRALR